jgi:hypothetical protein
MSDHAAVPAVRELIASAVPGRGTAPGPSGAASLPERPVLTLRVGITGHRDLNANAQKRIRTAVDRVLALIETVVDEVAANDGLGYADAPARLVAVSPLAEGADRVFAHAVLERRETRWALHVPMPFSQAEYEIDFPNSHSEFRNLLARAAGALELDGTREAQGLAYLHAGRTTLHQSDVLIAVWNGRSAERIGGTAQIVDEAYSHQIPIVWIDPHAASTPRLLTRPPREGPVGTSLENALPQLLREMLLPPHLLPHPVPHRDWTERLRGWIGGHTGRLGPKTYYQPVRT